MISGKLSCPKCHSTGMNGYEYYESKTFDDGEARWIFYNTSIKFKQWKCWALVEECGCRVHKCYDPFGCCFNPCDHTPDVVTVENGIEVNRQKDCCIGYLCCFAFFLVCYLIYALYVTIYFWYDLYYYFCKTSKSVRKICIGKTSKTIEDDKYLWYDNDINLFTEKFWCTNFPYIFICEKCNHKAKTFKDFLDINQKTENPVNIVTNQTDITNNVINENNGN